MVLVTDGVAIPDAEIAFTAARSGGPGGPNVNEVATRLTLPRDLDGPADLTP